MVGEQASGDGFQVFDFAGCVDGTEEFVPEAFVGWCRGEGGFEGCCGGLRVVALLMVGGEGEGGFDDEQAQLGVDDLVGEPGVAALGVVGQERAAGQGEGVGEEAFADGGVVCADSRGGLVVEGLEDVPVGYDGGRQGEAARGVGGQAWSAVGVVAEPGAQAC